MCLQVFLHLDILLDPPQVKVVFPECGQFFFRDDLHPLQGLDGVEDSVGLQGRVFACVQELKRLYKKLRLPDASVAALNVVAGKSGIDPLFQPPYFLNFGDVEGLSPYKGFDRI